MCVTAPMLAYGRFDMLDPPLDRSEVSSTSHNSSGLPFRLHPAELNIGDRIRPAVVHLGQLQPGTVQMT